MLILLDIDGVMVSAKSWSAPPILEDGFAMFNSKSVQALNEIIDKSKADILLTTSHKSRFSLEQWAVIFKNRGISINNIDKLPQNHRHLSRLEEITNWYTSNDNIDNFLIIDDDKSLNGLSSYLKTRLVLTKPLIGLTSSHVQDALRILNTPVEQVENVHLLKS